MSFETVASLGFVALIWFMFWKADQPTIIPPAEEEPNEAGECHGDD